jgi:hypothetical protein
MKSIPFVAALCVLLAGCEDADRSLITSSVTLSAKPLVLAPDRPLLSPAHFNQLCIAIPAEYRIESLTLRSDTGTEVRVGATLVDTDGESHSFTSQSFLLGRRRYVCLSSDAPKKTDVRYKQVSISSSAPLRTEEIRWISTDKL